MKASRILATLLVSLLFWFCSDPEEQPCCSGTQDPTSETLTDADRVGLVWNDEFDGTALNSNNWSYDIGDGSLQGLPGWGNGEKQYYTDRSDNLQVDDGFLKITAKKENFSGSEYTSARINTLGKFSFKQGRMVVRARLPLGTGTWPAVWMLGNSFPTAGWPYCGEIDVIEQRGLNKNVLIGATHWFDQATNARADFLREYTSAGIAEDFRKYTLEWTPEYLLMKVDGTQYFRMNINNTMPFGDPFFIIINIAMGGTLGGNIGPYFTSDDMWIDYIRIYEN